MFLLHNLSLAFSRIITVNSSKATKPQKIERDIYVRQQNIAPQRFHIIPAIHAYQGSKNGASEFLNSQNKDIYYKIAFFCHFGQMSFS